MKLISIFVEGITDVELYQNFITKCYGFRLSSPKKEESLRTKLSAIGVNLGKEFPFPTRRVRLLGKADVYISLQGKGGLENLKRFALTIINSWEEKYKSAFKDLKDKNIYIRSFFIFDEKIPDEVYDSYKCEIEFFITLTYQKYLPEDIILELFEKCNLQDNHTKFLRLLDCWCQINNIDKVAIEIEKNRNNYKKQKVNLLKSIVGERCHSHLFDILLGNREKCCERMERYLPEELILTLRKFS